MHTSQLARVVQEACGGMGQGLRVARHSSVPAGVVQGSGSWVGLGPRRTHLPQDQRESCRKHGVVQAKFSGHHSVLKCCMESCRKHIALQAKICRQHAFSRPFGVTQEVHSDVGQGPWVVWHSSMLAVGTQEVCSCVGLGPRAARILQGQQESCRKHTAA